MTQQNPKPTRLTLADSLLLVVDLQEKLVPVMQDEQTLTRRAVRLVRAAKALEVPTLVTEQYPKGLGHTLGKLTRFLGDAPVHEKLLFSACIEPVTEAIAAAKRRTIIVAGIEAHVCVLHTCLDLLERGFTVALPLDATASRRALDREAAVRRLIAAGVIPTSVESIMFEWTGTAEGEPFKRIRDIVKDDG